MTTPVDNHTETVDVNPPSKCRPIESPSGLTRTRWLDHSLMLYWQKHLHNRLELHQYFTSFAVIAQPGAGKSAAIIPAVLAPALLMEFGAVLLCITHGESHRMRELIHKCGQKRRVKEIGFGTNDSFDFLNAAVEAAPEGESPAANVVKTLEHAAEFVHGNAGAARREDAFFTSHGKAALQHLFQIQIAALGRVDLLAVKVLLLKLMGRDQEATSTLKDAAQRATRSQAHNTAQAFYYLLTFLPSLAAETSTGIWASALSFIEPFTVDPLYSAFGRPTTVGPKHALQGWIVIVDFPTDRDQFLGQIAAAIWKYGFQQEVQRRAIPEDKESVRPALICCDEFHIACSIDHDANYQSRARNYRATSIYGFQSLQSLFAVCGADPSNEAKVKSFLSNIGTKLIGNTNDPQTIEYVTGLAGSEWVLTAEHNESHNIPVRRSGWSRSGRRGSSRSPEESSGFSRSIRLHETTQIDPNGLMRLKTGGYSNQGRCEFYVFNNERRFYPDGRNHGLAEIVQIHPIRDPFPSVPCTVSPAPEESPMRTHCRRMWDMLITAGVKPFDGSREKAMRLLEDRRQRKKGSPVTRRLAWYPVSALIVSLLLFWLAGTDWINASDIGDVLIGAGAFVGGLFALLAAVVLFARGWAYGGVTAKLAKPWIAILNSHRWVKTMLGSLVRLAK